MGKKEHRCPSSCNECIPSQKLAIGCCQGKEVYDQKARSNVATVPDMANRVRLSMQQVLLELDKDVIDVDMVRQLVTRCATTMIAIGALRGDNTNE